ncbi:MAG: hypothetical protein JXA10_04485 [Anaerolineae bacterium]|nr:hypothetical protein [Anaerolineae bacterium]
MRENMRLYATLAIWFTFMVMTIVIFTASDAVSEPNTGVFIALILALAASISTAAIWISGMTGGHQRTTNSSASQAKRKRVDPDRLERLVAGLDDETLTELETLLIARAGMDEMQDEQNRY